MTDEQNHAISHAEKILRAVKLYDIAAILQAVTRDAPSSELLEAAKAAEKVIDILWVSHHANRADDALEKLRAAIAKASRATPADQEPTLPPSQRHLENTAKENERLRKRSATPADHMLDAGENVDAVSVPVAIYQIRSKHWAGRWEDSDEKLFNNIQKMTSGTYETRIVYAAPPSPQVSDNVRNSALDEAADAADELADMWAKTCGAFEARIITRVLDMAVRKIHKLKTSK